MMQKIISSKFTHRSFVNYVQQIKQFALLWRRFLVFDYDCITTTCLFVDNIYNFVKLSFKTRYTVTMNVTRHCPLKGSVTFVTKWHVLRKFHRDHLLLLHFNCASASILDPLVLRNVWFRSDSDHDLMWYLNDTVESP